MICLPSSIVEKFKGALKDGTINPSELQSMTSEERRTFLDDIVGKDSSQAVNTLLESKLALKDQQAGMIRWAKEVAGMKPEAQRDIVSRINKLDTLLNPSEQKDFLSDFAEKKLGTKVTADQAQKISDLAKAASDLKGKNPTMFGVSDEFLKAQNELHDYVNGLKYLSVGDSIGKNAGIIVKNNLILGVSTPLKTLIGQGENYFMDKVSSRLGGLITGNGAVGLSKDLVGDANTAAWKTAIDTGFRDNVASMESLDDAHALNRGEQFGTPQGQSDASGIMKGVEGIVRKTAQISNKIAIDIEHNVVFTKVYQMSFYDSADLVSSQYARSEGLKGDELTERANDIFKDSIKIQPETAEGKIVRNQAQIRAARITSTNDTWASTIAVAAKNALNKVSPDFPLGSILEPFAKIPANVIANGLDNSGLGLIGGAKDILQGYQGLDSDDIQTKTKALIQLTNGLQRVGRVVGTTALAALIVSKMKASSFMTNQYGATFMQIGNVWVNTEYLPIIGPTLAGSAAAKQGGGGLGTHVSNYIKGAGKSVLALPDYLAELTTADTQGIVKYGVNFATSFLTPAILKDIFEGGLKNIFSTDTALHVTSGAGVQTVSSYNAETAATKHAAAVKAAATRKAKGER